MLDLTTIPMRNLNVIGKISDEEAVLVMPQKGQVKVLNEVGACIWNLIDGKRDVQHIIDGICAEFDVDLITAEKDTIQFLTELIKRDIVEI
jgi:hypothetical protein